MESETSAIARKLQNFVVIENEPPRRSFHKHKIETPNEPGVFKNIILISLMAMAVVLTHTTLILVKWTKSLEGN